MVELTPTAKNFIIHWGELGTRWGVNRTVAQIHALLYVSPEPLTAETISETLSLARSTVSVSLRELQSWGVVNVVHILGDRRDYFETMSDVWEMLLAVLNERKQRELDPTLKMLRDTTAELESSTEEDPQTKKKLLEMLDFFETVESFYEQIQKLPLETLIRIAKMNDAAHRILKLGSR